MRGTDAGLAASCLPREHSMTPEAECGSNSLQAGPWQRSGLRLRQRRDHQPELNIRLDLSSQGTLPTRSLKAALGLGVAKAFQASGAAQACHLCQEATAYQAA